MLLTICSLVPVLSLIGLSATGQEKPASKLFHATSAHHNPPDLSVVTPSTWRAIDNSVDRALVYLASQQQPDGSIPTMDVAKPAVTALYAMAAISAGHEPGVGPHGESINRAIDYILDSQNEDGLYSRYPVSFLTDSISKPGQVAVYNQGICGTLLGEVYGMTDSDRAVRIKVSIEKALDFVRTMQNRPKVNAIDNGGFRYIKQMKPGHSDSDLSVTSWLIMFMRSAHNAGFDVPEAYVNETIDYVRRCYVPETGEFRYSLVTQTHTTRGLTGVGVLCLFLTGNHDNEMERQSGRWLMQQSFQRFNVSPQHDRFFYAAYYCSQAAYQLGGEYWAKLYVPLAETLVARQNSNGSWDADHHDFVYRDTYSTAMAVLALTPPYQLLPIYQR